MAINPLASALMNGSEFNGQTGGAPPPGYRGSLWPPQGSPERGQPPAGGVPAGYRGTLWPGGMAAGTGGTLAPTPTSGGPPLANPGLGARSTGLPIPPSGGGGSAGFNAPSSDGAGQASVSGGGSGAGSASGSGFGPGVGIGGTVGGLLGGVTGIPGGGLVGGAIGTGFDTARTNSALADMGFPQGSMLSGYGPALAANFTDPLGLATAMTGGPLMGTSNMSRANDVISRGAQTPDEGSAMMDFMAGRAPARFGMSAPAAPAGDRSPGLAGQGGYTNPGGGGRGDPMSDLGRSDFGQGFGGGNEGSGGGGGGGGEGGGVASDPGGGMFAAGGLVTPDRLIGPNPPGPDEGYAALQSGEIVIPREQVQMLAQALQQPERPLPAMPPPSATRGLTDDQVLAMQARPGMMAPAAPPPPTPPAPHPAEGLIRALRFGFGSVPTPQNKGLAR